MKDLTKSFLGRSAIDELRLLQLAVGVGPMANQTISTVSNSDLGSQITDNHPQILDSLGNFQTEMVIQFKDVIQPYTQKKPIVVPMLLLGPLE